MSTRLLCPRGHLIATVDIRDGRIDPRGTNHGLSWGHNPKRDITDLRATCRRCTYDASVNYATLCSEVIAAVAAGHVEYRLTV